MVKFTLEDEKYLFGVIWLSHNVDLGKDDDIPKDIGVCLLADMFELTTQQVASDIIKYRETVNHATD